MSIVKPNDFIDILTKKREEFLENYLKPPSPSVTFDDFERIRTLGRGAFGRVLLVRHHKSVTYYAMKILSKTEIVKSKQIDNAINEKRILAACDFVFIIKLYYSFKDNSYLYMVLEFVIGGEMFTLLRNMRRFPENMVKFYGAQVVLAFEYLHFMSIVYRDLKPENLLISANGFLKVADLGFAKIIPKDKRTWTLCGTPDYMAPEIIMNKGYHTSVDWWAFGVLMYEMTTGFPPFMHQDQMKTFEHIVSGKIKYTNGFQPDLKNLINNLIQVDLSRRYGNLKNGINDIKDHPYFEGFNWIQLYEQHMKPPFKPKCSGPADTSCFEKWDEEVFKVADKDKFKNEFSNF